MNYKHHIAFLVKKPKQTNSSDGWRIIKNRGARKWADEFVNEKGLMSAQKPYTCNVVLLYLDSDIPHIVFSKNEAWSGKDVDHDYWLYDFGDGRGEIMFQIRAENDEWLERIKEAAMKWSGEDGEEIDI